MTQNGSGPISLVLASIDSKSTIEQSLRRFCDEVRDRGEVVVVDGSEDGSAELAEQRFPGVRVLRRRPGTLAPQLWRDGLRATDSPLVAFSTTQMAPRDGWLDRLLERLSTSSAAAMGGAIAPSPNLSATNRALYLMRYASYCPPVVSSQRFEPPGDNAIYVRAQLEGLESAWASGFWEIEVHRRLLDRNERIDAAPDAVVEFLGGASLRTAAWHRFSHARHYGLGRAKGWRWGLRAVRSASAPLILSVLLARILRSVTTRGVPARFWLPALPPLTVLLSVWSAGEAAGTFFGAPIEQSHAV
jgi:hypothetical protein